MRRPRVELTPEEKALRKQVNRRRRIIGYGSIVAIAWGFWTWVPWEFDLIERKPAKPLPLVDPDSKKLFSKGSKVLVVTAHPDDSEFYIGGTLTLLSKNADIDQVIVTDGDKSYYWFFTNADENRRIRREEATMAKDTWKGKSIQFLGYPDGRLSVDDELVDKLANIVTQLRPDYVMAFDGDFPPRFSHRDHRRAGIAAAEAVKKAHVPLWLMQFSTSAPNYFVDITDVWENKADLLKVHASQFNGERLKRVTNMVAGLAESDGEKSNLSLAEGFHCIRIE